MPQSAETVLYQMVSILNELIANAEMLKNASHSCLSEEELAMSQNVQNKLVEELMACEEAFWKLKEKSQEIVHEELQAQIRFKLNLFLFLNNGNQNTH